MKTKNKSVSFSEKLYGLRDEDVDYRNKARAIVLFAIWLVLTCLTVILALQGVTQATHVGVIVSMSILKYLPLLGVVYYLAKAKAASYLDDIYELGNPSLASDFIEEVAFGYGREKITIKEGRIPESDEKSPLILIGGPGEIQVNLDSVALLEKVNGDPEVIFPRNKLWKLGRFERIREIGKFDEVGKREYAIINLRDQFVSGILVKSRTKDGLPIEASGIKVIFSLLRRQQRPIESVQGDAYLFDERAVQALVYNQTTITPTPLAPPGVNFPWDSTIVPLIIAELEDLIRTRTLSELLANISQKEVDNSSSNEHTIAQMRVEMTGQMTPLERLKESHAPNFESRTKITAQFFTPEFKEKAAKLGVSIEWIDIGTWQLPNALILDKHKEAWALSRENSKKREAVENSSRRFQMKEIASLVKSIIIANYDKDMEETEKIDKEDKPETVVRFSPEYRNKYLEEEEIQKDPRTTAMNILKAFRKELTSGKSLIEKDGRSAEAKKDELEAIQKALDNIAYLTNHWLRPS